MRYDAEIGPDRDKWDTLGESERIELICEYHQRLGAETPNERLHAMIHLTVENQVQLGSNTPVAAVLKRLVSEGLTKHEAVHAIGSVLAEHLFDLARESTPGADPLKAYFEQVGSLSAQSWLQSV